MTSDGLQEGYDTLEKAAALFKDKFDEEAHRLNRLGVEKVFIAFHRSFQGPVLEKLLMGFHSLAVTSFVTGRSDEGLVALGTGLTYAEVGLKNWPGAAPLLEQQAELQALEKKVGLRTTGLLVEDVTDDWHWPFDD